MLPDAWIEELTEQTEYVKPSERVSFTEHDTEGILTGGQPCQAVVKALDKYGARKTDDHARYIAMRDTQLEIVRLGEQGHQGVNTAIDALHELYLADTKDEKRDTEGEFDRALIGTETNPGGAIGKVLADPTPDEDKGCCSHANDSAGIWPPNMDTETGEVPIVEPATLTECHNTFKKWLSDDYDTDTLAAMLAAAAVERLDGDPLWLLIVSGSGNAKTETVQALSSIGALVVSAITSEGALLSATEKRGRSKNATGGLLREIGDHGVLVIKDFTSILSMNRDLRAQVLGALREVHDGSWVRKVGSDGGQSLLWAGRIAIIGAVTTAWDTHHAVVAAMGDRFVLVRADSTTKRQEAGRQAIGNTGSETQMRAELASAVAGVLAGMNTTPITVTDKERDALLAAADLVTLSRTAVERDYQGNVIDAHAPEMPTRFAKELVQIIRGSVAVGMDRHGALRLAIRCARDSMPPLRLAIIDDIAAHPNSSVSNVRKRVNKPHNTVDREVQALYMLGVLACEEAEEFVQKTGKWASKWYYSLADGVDPTAIDLKTFPEKSVHTPYPKEEGFQDSDEESVLTDKSGNGATPPTDFSGHPPPPTCWRCGKELWPDGSCSGCRPTSNLFGEEATA
jgi:hypothetical protein